MASLPLAPAPGTPRCVVSLGRLELPADGPEADDEPVACWYDGGGSAGTSELDMLLMEGGSVEVRCLLLGRADIRTGKSKKVVEVASRQCKGSRGACSQRRCTARNPARARRSGYVTNKGAMLVASQRFRFAPQERTPAAVLCAITIGSPPRCSYASAFLDSPILP